MDHLSKWNELREKQTTFTWGCDWVTFAPYLARSSNRRKVLLFLQFRVTIISGLLCRKTRSAKTKHDILICASEDDHTSDWNVKNFNYLSKSLSSAPHGQSATHSWVFVWLEYPSVNLTAAEKLTLLKAVEQRKECFGNTEMSNMFTLR